MLLCRHLSDRGLPTFYDRDASQSANVRDVQYKDGDHWDTWHRAGYEKMYACLAIMRLGYDVFLSDIDLVILRNPWPHFMLDADFEYQVEVPFFESEIKPNVQINVGYFYAKNNAKMQEVFNRTIHWKRTKVSVEQDIVNMIKEEKLKNNEAIFLNYTDPKRSDAAPEDKLVLRMKPVLEFPSGGALVLLSFYLRKIGSTVREVHILFPRFGFARNGRDF